MWQRLEGEIIPALALLQTLAKGEALVLQASWDLRTRRGAPVPPGIYHVRGLLLAETEPLASAPVILTVSPR